jgi:hypothetical protein
VIRRGGQTIVRFENEEAIDEFADRQKMSDGDREALRALELRQEVERRRTHAALAATVAEIAEDRAREAGVPIDPPSVEAPAAHQAPPTAEVGQSLQEPVAGAPAPAEAASVTTPSSGPKEVASDMAKRDAMEYAAAESQMSEPEVRTRVLDAADQNDAYRATLQANNPLLYERLHLRAERDREAAQGTFLDPGPGANVRESQAARGEHGAERTTTKAAAAPSDAGADPWANYTADADARDRAAAGLPPNPNWNASARVAEGTATEVVRTSLAPQVQADDAREQEAALQRAETGVNATAAVASAAEQRRRQETIQAALAATNSVDVQRKGGELERDEFIIPRRILQSYTEHDGKFFAKDSNRMMFHDQGEKLATSTTDKVAIADMVAYARAKQWESLKLTGSQEFRREAWLQAESQGIKTQGFTPRDVDLAALKTLTQERSTNTITPLEERAKPQPTPARELVASAPRHDLNKNQAGTAAAAAQGRTSNIAELQQKRGFEKYSMDDLAKIAFYRALLVEREKGAPAEQRDAVLAKFDTTMRDPQKVRDLPQQEVKAAERGKSVERPQQRDTAEQSL